jgi:arylsulfatase
MAVISSLGISPPWTETKPSDLAELYKANDVELFDLQTDRSETANLAVDQEKNGDLIAKMSSKLESLIKAEIGADNGREMPELAKVTWTIDRVDL